MSTFDKDMIRNGYKYELKVIFSELYDNVESRYYNPTLTYIENVEKLNEFKELCKKRHISIISIRNIILN